MPLCAVLVSEVLNEAQSMQMPPMRSGRRESLLERYGAVRGFSDYLCAPLCTEDYVVQTMPDVSPTKWHLAHTTWFFETFVLREGVAEYKPFEDAFAYLFNSYYNTVGKQFPRLHRGCLSRPTVREVYAYRAYVDEQMVKLLQEAAPAAGSRLAHVIEVGLQHEQQHQELIVTDIKHVLCSHPLCPPYRSLESGEAQATPGWDWVSFEGGLHWLGAPENQDEFFYDNEGPAHRVFLDDFSLASRLITNAEYLAFVEDGGYRDPLLWLSEGWRTVQESGWAHPLYWEKSGEAWMERTLHGLVPLDPAAPVCHVSHFEADAFARWSGARLPTEAEWEVASAEASMLGNFVEEGRFHPMAAEEGTGLRQMFGDVWEWTQSPYVAYPGYAPEPGALGEYNGKFMCNQIVLRGGSCATSASHIRRTYRNFFPSSARWQFSGIRLARHV